MAERRIIFAVCTLGFFIGHGASEELPTSYGAVAKVDTPILRIPHTKNPPKIDGVMAEGEWEDASALSGFWYDFAQAKFYFLAPIQTQLQVYAAFDKEKLYIAYSSPVYPEGSWLKARGRFPDVSHHPLYGVLWDDHVELELRPYHDIAKGFKLGLLKWFINPIATYADFYWSINHGERKKYLSKAVVRCGVDDKRWIIEISIPLQQMVFLNYNGKDENGKPLVNLPPADGTVYRCWFTRGIGGNGQFFNVFDNHMWNTTKTMLVFDSKAPSFQINELGPIMDDVIDLRMTVKNLHSQSQTVRIGFFVESEEGLIYSSYDSPDLNGGLLELVPGEVKKLRLKKPFPGVSVDGNVLWFDIRSGGRPSKSLFRTRLIRFHSMDGGRTNDQSFRERRLEVIKELRPPRQDFSFRYDISTYNKRIVAIVDKGIHGASREAKRATEAKLFLMKDNEEEDELAEVGAAFAGEFAIITMDLPELINGESYNISLLLFDENKRIVGERNPEPFQWEIPIWQDNPLGRDDVVWEPFVPIQKTKDGFETLDHRFTVSPTGLPEQIDLKHDVRELPLEKRSAAQVSGKDLLEIGRGPQLRKPIRFRAIIGGQQVEAKVKKKAKLVRQWKSEFEYASRLTLGPLDINLTVQYDCDGTMHCRLAYGSKKPVKVSSFEIVMDVKGLVDLALTSANGGGMAAADIWECTLPQGEGIVWDSREKVDTPSLYYSCFVPWVWFGSADRAFTWFSDTDRGMFLDRDGSSMTFERDEAGDVTWRMKFINHEAVVESDRQIELTMLTHPAKPKPKDFRRIAWFYRGGTWADEYIGGRLYKSDEELISKARVIAQSLDKSFTRDSTNEDLAKWRKPDPPYWRFYQLRNLGVPKEAGVPEMDRRFQDKWVFWFERHIRIGRRHGWWWDETWPVYRSDNIAEGNAYLRDPADVKKNELPWQAGFLTGHMRGMFKRLARVFKNNNVPLRNYLWANNSATCFESFAWDTMLVEECGSDHRTFEVDMVTQFPNSLFRYMSHGYTGLIARVVPGPAQALQGDDKRLDRQYLGRALLNDIGVSFEGPHGNFAHREQAIRLLNALNEFGFFKDEGIEKIPFWRNGSIVRFGKDGEAGEVYVTVYRRSLDGGIGFKALIVIMNESDKPVELPLNLLNPERILGGVNTLKAGEIRAKANVPDELKEWWANLSGNSADVPALMDLESGEAILKLGTEESYGPVYVPYHDFRILYTHSEK